jgi:hypothetical protein
MDWPCRLRVCSEVDGDTGVAIRLGRGIRVVLDVGRRLAHVGQSICRELTNWLATVRRRLRERQQHMVRNHVQLSAVRSEKWWRLTYVFAYLLRLRLPWWWGTPGMSICLLLASLCIFCQFPSNHLSTITAQQLGWVAHQLGIAYRPSSIRHIRRSN